MSETTKKINTLNEKINIIQNFAVEIEMTGLNKLYTVKDGKKGNYKSFTDIKKAVYKKMGELEIVVLPFGDIRNLKIEGKQVQYTRWMYVGDKDTKIVFDKDLNTYVCENGIPFEWEFLGNNSNDEVKAHGSAITYALKYIFNLLWLLPDESLDADNENYSSQNTKQKPKQKSNNHVVDNEAYETSEVVISGEVMKKSIKDFVLNEPEKATLILDKHGIKKLTDISTTNMLEAIYNETKEIKK